MINNKIKLFLILIILLSFNIYNCKENISPKKIPVYLDVIKERNISPILLLSGQVKPYVSTDIFTYADGIIQRINAKVGDFVEADTVLFEVDRVRQTGMDFKLLQIETPISGIILDIPIEVGQRVNNEIRLTTVAQNDFLKIEAFTNPTNANLIEKKYTDKNKKIPCYVLDRNSKEKHVAYIHKIYPALNKLNKMVQLDIIMKNDNNIKIGDFTEIEVNLPKRKTILCPRKALLYRDNFIFMALYNPILDSVYISNVIIDDYLIYPDNNIEILKGVVAGEIAISEGQHYLKAGNKIEITNYNIEIDNAIEDFKINLPTSNKQVDSDKDSKKKISNKKDRN